MFIEPLVYFNDAPCPSCGSLVWFVRLGAQNILVEPSEELRARGLLETLSRFTGLSESELRADPESLARVEYDSMDAVELAIELENGDQTMMTERIKIKMLLEKRPFRPFVIHTSDGDAARVKAPDFAWIHPAGETMYVCPDPEVDADLVINLSHITRIASRASMGDGKKRPR